jgi:hypothetical protein
VNGPRIILVPDPAKQRPQRYLRIPRIERPGRHAPRVGGEERGEPAGVDDAVDIAAGTSADVDEDGVPDECGCIADLDGDGAVTGADLAVLLGAWGSCAACGADLTGDGQVLGDDLAVLLSSWGACGAS